MERALTVMLTARNACYVFFGGTGYLLTRDAPLMLPAARGTELVFTVWSAEPNEIGRVSIPAAQRITIGEDGNISSSVRTVDWGGVIEAELEPYSIEAPCFEDPLLLDKADFYFGERRASAELYRDNGLRLALTPRGGETFSFPIGKASEGRLSLYDTGGSRLLSVWAKRGGRERLVMLNARAETVFDAEADLARIEDGFPTLLTRLGTVKGHEKRERYEFRDPGFTLYSRDTGFFTHSAGVPSGDAQKALSIAEELRLGVYDGAEFLTPKLAGELGSDSLRAYFGDYTGEKLYPAEEPSGRVTLGLFGEDSYFAAPRRFLFEFANGLVSDVREL